MNKLLIDRINLRLKDLGKTARSASLEATGNPDTIRRIIHGRAAWPRTDTLAGLARALETTPEWLMGKSDEPSIATTASPSAASIKYLPVFGLAAGSFDGEHSMTNDPIEEVPAPPGLQHVFGAYALLTRGDSMIPRYMPNDRLYINPHQEVRPGDHVVVQTRLHDSSGTETWVKRYDGATDGEVLCWQYNPATELRFDKRYVISIHRVLTNNELFPA